MTAKLGFAESTRSGMQLVRGLLQQMQQSGADYTRVFRGLAGIEHDTPAALRDEFVERERFDRWPRDYCSLLAPTAGGIQVSCSS